MFSYRRALAVAGFALSLVAVPSAAVAADTMTPYQVAHADFVNPAGEPTKLRVDIETAAGVTTLNVEWSSTTCQTAGDTWTCFYVSRNAYDQTPTRFEFSLQQAELVADVSYTEYQHTCSYDGVSEICGSVTQTGTGTAHLEVSWTAAGEPRTFTYRSEDGRVLIQTIVYATATAEMFGEVFTAERSEGSTLGVSRVVEPGH